MIGIVITGHGMFGTGMSKALKMIGGDFENIAHVDFTNDLSFEDLESKLKNAMNSMKHCDEFVVLTDIAGGSPFKAAVLLSINEDNIKVVSGVNLPIFLHMALSRSEEENVSGFVERAIHECGGSIDLLRVENLI